MDGRCSHDDVWIDEFFEKVDSIVQLSFQSRQIGTKFGGGSRGWHEKQNLYSVDVRLHPEGVL